MGGWSYAPPTKTMRKKIYYIIILLPSISIIIYIGYQVPWMGFSGKTVWDWLEIAIIPIFLGISVMLFDYFQRRNEKISREEERKINMKLSIENYSRKQFDDFLSYLMDNNIGANTIIEESKKNIIKYKVRSMFRTMNSFWIGELFDFISTSKIIKEIPDIFSENKFSNIDISQADLSGSKILSVEFLFSNMNAIKLIESDIFSCKIDNSNISGSNLSYSNKRNSFFNECSMKGVNLEKSAIASCKYIKSNLEKSIFYRSKIVSSVFQESNIINSNAIKCEMIKTRFENLEIKESDLTGAKIHECFFIDCKINNCEIYNAEIYKTTFKKCIFEGIDFRKCNISQISLEGCTYIDCIITWNENENENVNIIDNEEAVIRKISTRLIKPSKLRRRKKRLTNSHNITRRNKNATDLTKPDNSETNNTSPMKMAINKTKIYNIYENCVDEKIIDRIYYYTNARRSDYKYMIRKINEEGISKNKIRKVINLLIHAAVLDVLCNEGTCRICFLLENLDDVLLRKKKFSEELKTFSQGKTKEEIVSFILDWKNKWI